MSPASSDSQNPVIRGSLVALLTPFKDGKVDEKAFQDFVNWQIEQGTEGLVPCGTTGESPTLSHAEHKRVIELCIEVAGGRVPVIAGTGSNATAEAVDFAIHAAKAGADAQLLVAPYYNKPTQEGLYRHYKAVHDAAELPLIVYNIPGRSIVDISIGTMARIAGLPRVIGVKDSTADLARPVQTRLTCGDDFVILSGEDATALALMAQSGDGCISVTANIAPRLCADMHAAWRAGDFAAARALNERLMPLHDAMFCETSPGPVKYAAELLGLCGSEARLPVCEIDDASKKCVEEALAAAGLTAKSSPRAAAE